MSLLRKIGDMDSYVWTEDAEAFEAVAYQVRTLAGEEVGEGAVGREILGLAQREADLLEILSRQGRQIGQFAARIAELEAELSAAHAKVTDLQGGIEAREKIIFQQDAQIRELRSLNAKKLRELRQAAAERDHLPSALEGALDRKANVQASADRSDARTNQLIREPIPLTAAIGDGLAHVQRAQRSNLFDGEHGRQFRAELLDLAHEALTKAVDFLWRDRQAMRGGK